MHPGKSVSTPGGQSHKAGVECAESRTLSQRESLSPSLAAHAPRPLECCGAAGSALVRRGGRDAGRAGAHGAGPAAGHPMGRKPRLARSRRARRRHGAAQYRGAAQQPGEVPRRPRGAGARPGSAQCAVGARRCGHRGLGRQARRPESRRGRLGHLSARRPGRGHRREQLARTRHLRGRGLSLPPLLHAGHGPGTGRVLRAGHGQPRGGALSVAPHRRR